MELLLTIILNFAATSALGLTVLSAIREAEREELSRILMKRLDTETWR
jgi:hypothetical protein